LGSTTQPTAIPQKRRLAATVERHNPLYFSAIELALRSLRSVVAVKTPLFIVTIPGPASRHSHNTLRIRALQLYA
jgi:hypothetical protein